MSDWLQDDFLTPEEYAANGITPADGDALWRWVYERLGLVMTQNGPVGSGVFVQCTGGQIALLTARHVFVAALRNGYLSVVSFNDRQGSSSRPIAIRLSTTCDAALFVMGADSCVPFHLTCEEWCPEEYQEVACDTRAISAGLPGYWRGTVDLGRRTMTSPKILIFWAGVVATEEERHEVRLFASRGEGRLPLSLKGVSGGPVFTLQRRLVGLNRAESQRPKNGELIVTTRSAWIDLTRAHAMPSVSSDVTVENRCVGLVLKPSQLSVHLDASFFFSVKTPDHSWGRIERIVFNKGCAAKEIAVSIDRPFYFPSEPSESDRMEAFLAEAKLLLEFLEVISSNASREIG